MAAFFFIEKTTRETRRRVLCTVCKTSRWGNYLKGVALREPYIISHFHIYQIPKCGANHGSKCWSASQPFAVFAASFLGIQYASFARCAYTIINPPRRLPSFKSHTASSNKHAKMLQSPPDSNRSFIGTSCLSRLPSKGDIRSVPRSSSLRIPDRHSGSVIFTVTPSSSPSSLDLPFATFPTPPARSATALGPGTRK